MPVHLDPMWQDFRLVIFLKEASEAKPSNGEVFKRCIMLEKREVDIDVKWLPDV